MVCDFAYHMAKLWCLYSDIISFTIFEVYMTSGTTQLHLGFYATYALVHQASYASHKLFIFQSVMPKAWYKHERFLACIGTPIVALPG